MVPTVGQNYRAFFKADGTVCVSRMPSIAYVFLPPDPFLLEKRLQEGVAMRFSEGFLFTTGHPLPRKPLIACLRAFLMTWRISFKAS